MTSRCTRQHLTHRFSPGSKLLFGTVVGWLTCWVRSYDSCDMEHAAPGSVLRASRSSNASSRLPGPPAGGRGKDGRIHNDSSRYSTAAQREVAPLCLYIYCHHFFVHFHSVLACGSGGRWRRLVACGTHVFLFVLLKKKLDFYICLYPYFWFV